MPPRASCKKDQVTRSSDRDHRRPAGNSWACGWFEVTGFNTVLPPNSIGCVTTRPCWNLMPPDSYHPGGVNVLIADGSVRFISEYDQRRESDHRLRPQAGRARLGFGALWVADRVANLWRRQ